MNLYECYVDGDKFYDVRVDDLPLIDPVLELKTNSAGTFTFTVPPEHPKYDSFKPLTSTIEIYRDGKWFWEGRIIDVNTNFYNEKNCTVEGALSYLNDSIQPQAEFHDINPIGYVENLLNVHNSMVADNRKINLGAITVVDPNNSMYRYTNYNSTLQELKEDMIDDLGGIIRLRKTGGQLYLDILDEPDRICSQIIRLGQNLIDLAPDTDYTDIASVIIPLGATLEDQEEHEEGLEALDKYVEITELNDGKNYLARDDLIENFDQIWKKVSFPNIHTPQGLMEKAKKYLTDTQWGEMVIEAKAFDLNYTDEEFQEFRLNDRVRVKSDYHGIDRYFPLTAQTIHFNDPSQNTITLGGTGEPVSITGVTNQVTLSNEKLTERVKDPNRLIQQAIYQATQLITHGLNGYVRVDGNEILIMDTDDPTTAKHVWRWNMGGLGYSNNGYEGPFETAITMDGTIVGKFLAANSIAAEQIDISYTDHVEKQCNEYTDGKLGSYWTYEQTETYFRNESGKWEMGVLSKVDTKLGDYTTTEYFESQLTLTKEQFNTTLSNYSDTKSVQSMIDQTAEIITTSVTDKFDDVYSEIKQTKDEITTTLQGFATNGQLQTLEQKVTTDGIFTTINTGLAGSKNFKTTKFTMDKDGLEIQGGGLTIKNNSGTQVLWAGSDGNLTFRGDYVQYDSTGKYKVWEIVDNQINFYHYKNGKQLLRILNWNDTTVYFDTMNNTPMQLAYGGYPLLYISNNSITMGGDYSPDPTVTLNGSVNITGSSLRVRYVREGYQAGSYSTGYNGTINGCKFVNGICVGSG